MKTRRQRQAAKSLALKILSNSPRIPQQNHASTHDPKTLSTLHCTPEQAIEAIKSTSVDGFEFEDVVNMFATYIQKLHKLSTRKKKPQRINRLQNIQIFENLQKKQKLTTPSEKLSLTGYTLESPNRVPLSFLNDFGNTEHIEPALFLKNQGSMAPESSFKTLPNSHRFDSDFSIDSEDYRKYFNCIQESPRISDFSFVEPQKKTKFDFQVKEEDDGVKKEFQPTTSFDWLEMITPEDIQKIMNTLKKEPVESESGSFELKTPSPIRPLLTTQRKETELTISPRFYESPKSKTELKAKKVKNSMINSYISYMIYGFKNTLDNEKLQLLFPTFSMIFNDDIIRTEKSTGLPITHQTNQKTFRGFRNNDNSAWSFSKNNDNEVIEEESEFEISSPYLIDEDLVAQDEVEIEREFIELNPRVDVDEENFINPIKVDKNNESETLCLKMITDTILNSHLPAQTSQPMMRPTFCRFNAIFDSGTLEVHAGENDNRMMIEEEIILREPNQDVLFFDQEQQQQSENVSLEYESCGVEALEGDKVVSEGYYGYDSKEDVKKAFDDEYYQAKANNVYYVISVLLVAIVAKLYMSMFRMYSLRST